MNHILEEIVRTGKVLSADGTQSLALHSNVSADEGLLIASIIQSIKPSLSVEIGLAYGTSALYICDALRRSNAAAKHIIIDPSQNAPGSWQGIGLANLERAGFSAMVEFIEKPSQIALPELVSSRRSLDFAFIDGWHTFDHALVDFFCRSTSPSA